MNYWTKLSIEYANQRNYLDDLFQVYPTISNGVREVNKKLWDEIEISFKQKDNALLIKNLCLLEKFPVKDSYIAFLKMDLNSVDRNPQTINRIAGILYKLGLDELWDKCSEPKETNTQIGPMFKQWIDKKSLGILPIGVNEFLSTKDNAILKGGDTELNRFAKEHFSYSKDKGLDFVARFNGKYILGETKFITAINGNQNNSFTQPITSQSNRCEVQYIRIADGFNIENYYKHISSTHPNHTLISILVLREFLYQI